MVYVDSEFNVMAICIIAFSDDFYRVVKLFKHYSLLIVLSAD